MLVITIFLALFNYLNVFYLTFFSSRDPGVWADQSGSGHLVTGSVGLRPPHGVLTVWRWDHLVFWLFLGENHFSCRGNGPRDSSQYHISATGLSSRALRGSLGRGQGVYQRLSESKSQVSLVLRQKLVCVQAAQWWLLVNWCMSDDLSLSCTHLTQWCDV